LQGCLPEYFSVQITESQFFCREIADVVPPLPICRDMVIDVFSFMRASLKLIRRLPASSYFFEDRLSKKSTVWIGRKALLSEKYVVERNHAGLSHYYSFDGFECFALGVGHVHSPGVKIMC